MLRNNEENSGILLPPVQLPDVPNVPPAPQLPPAPPQPQTPIVAVAETLAEWERSIRALLDSGMTLESALAAHPEPANASDEDIARILHNLQRTETVLHDTQFTPQPPTQTPQENQPSDIVPSEGYMAEDETDETTDDDYQRYDLITDAIDEQILAAG